MTPSVHSDQVSDRTVLTFLPALLVGSAAATVSVFALGYVVDAWNSVTFGVALLTSAILISMFGVLPAGPTLFVILMLGFRSALVFMIAGALVACVYAVLFQPPTLTGGLLWLVPSGAFGGLATWSFCGRLPPLAPIQRS